MPDSVWGTDPIFMYEDGQYYYYHNDHLGTPQKMTDGSGNVVWTAKYTAFGEAVVDITSTVTNNLLYPGQYFDDETGLHYNQQRYYNPKTGRYTQVDPIGFEAQDENLYRYVGNDPVAFIDPMGLNKSLCEALQYIADQEELKGGPENFSEFLLPSWILPKADHTEVANQNSNNGMAIGYKQGGENYVASNGDLVDVHYIETGFAATMQLRTNLGKTPKVAEWLSNSRVYPLAQIVRFVFNEDAPVIALFYVDEWRMNNRGWKLGAKAARLGSIRALFEEECMLQCQKAH